LGEELICTKPVVCTRKSSQRCRVLVLPAALGVLQQKCFDGETFRGCRGDLGDGIDDFDRATAGPIEFSLLFRILVLDRPADRLTNAFCRQPCAEKGYDLGFGIGHNAVLPLWHTTSQEPAIGAGAGSLKPVCTGALLSPAGIVSAALPARREHPDPWA